MTTRDVALRQATSIYRSFFRGPKVSDCHTVASAVSATTLHRPQYANVENCSSYYCNGHNAQQIILLCPSARMRICIQYSPGSKEEGRDRKRTFPNATKMSSPLLIDFVWFRFVEQTDTAVVDSRVDSQKLVAHKDIRNSVTDKYGHHMHS